MATRECGQDEIRLFNDASISTRSNRATLLYTIQLPSRNPIKEKIFVMEAQNHFSEIFSVLLTFRKEGLLCDTVIVTRNKELLAHGVLLAAASPVFRSAFQDSENAGQHYINLPDVDSVIIEIALHFIYTGKLLLPDVYTQTNELPKLFAALHLLGLDPQKLNDCERTYKSSVETTVRKQMKDVRRRRSGKSQIFKQLKSYNVTIAPEDSPERNQDAASPDGNSVLSEPLENDVVTELVISGLPNASQLQPFVPTLVSEALEQDDSDFAQTNASPMEKRKRGIRTVNKSRELPSADNVVTRSKRRQFCNAAKATVPDAQRNIDVAESKSMVGLHTGLKCDSPMIEADQEIGSGSEPACLLESSGVEEEVTTESERKELRSTPSPTKPTYSVMIPKKNSSKNDCEIVSAQYSQINTGEKVHICFFCNKTFSIKSNLERHERRHTGIAPHLCELCGMGFIQKTALQDHMKIHKEETVAEVFKEKIDKEEIRAKVYKQGEIYSCSECEFAFNFETNLRKHIQKVHLIPDVKVKQNDVKVQEKKSIQCNLCGKGFASVNSLKLHKKLHSGDKPFVCLVCGEAFVVKAQLQYHARLHTGEKPFVCPTCEKGFVSKLGLTQHIRTHTGDRPYICTICDKGFAQSAHLKRHARSHTGEKPNICHLCSKAYRNRLDLRVHYSRKHDMNITQPKPQITKFDQSL